MKKGVVFALLLTLSACSTMDALKAVNPMKEDKGISATVQLGKENHSDTSKQLIKAKVGITETNDIKGNQTINKTTNVPWWSALLLLLVRPMVILKEVIDLFRRKPSE